MKRAGANTLGFLVQGKRIPVVLATILLIGVLLMYAIAAALIGTDPAQAASISKLINYQGKITKVSDGTNVVDATYAMEFKLYAALSGGSPLWTETYDQPSGVCAKPQLTNGVFSVKLGACNSLAAIDFTPGSLYLTVNFAPTGTSYDGEMSPRKQLNAAAFAFNANNLAGDGRIDLAYAPGDATNPAAKIFYNPSVASSNNALALSNNSNATGVTLLVTTAGSGAGIELAGAGAAARTINSTAAALTLQTTTSGNVILNAGGSSTIELQDNTNITGTATISSILQVGSATATTYSRLGTGSTGHSLNGANDLLISDALEVDGSTYLDGTLAVASTISSNSSITAGTSISVGDTSLSDGSLYLGAGTGTLSADGGIVVDNGISFTANGVVVLGDNSDAITLDGNGTVTINDAVIALSNQATDLDIRDNSTTGLTITEAANQYLLINTDNTNTVVTLDTPVAGATSTTLNLGTAAVAKTINIGSTSDSALKLKKFSVANGVLYVSATDGTVSETAASTAAQCLQTAGSGTAPIWGSCGGGAAYATVQEEGSSLTQRAILNFIGSGVTCVDDGSTKTNCTVSSGGGGVSLGPASADSVSGANSAVFINHSGTGNLLRLQSGAVDKFLVGNAGNTTISVSTSDVMKTTTGTTLATDFSITGSTLTNVTSSNDLITINEGTIPASGAGTMATSAVVTAAAAGAGSHTIQREDGFYVVIHGNSVATGSRWDGSSGTMTSVTVATGAVNPGVGSIALKRPDGRYLIIHGNASAGLTSLFDPRGVTAVAAGPAVCGAGAATTGTNAFLLQNGKYLIICGGLTAWGIYDPTANTYSAGTAVASAFGAGAHGIQRDDGTFLIFRGANTTSHWIYNPFASATGTMTADPITSNAPTINTGAFSIRRNDGKYLVMGGAINTSSIYDPTRTSVNSGAGTMTPQSGAGFGPTVALADGAQALWRQDGKYIVMIGAGSTVTNILDPSVSTSSQFTSGPALPAAPGAGTHWILRPNGQYQIVRGGATTTTDNYDMGFIVGGNGSGTQLASYETECITSTSLNTKSSLIWNANQEGTLSLQVKTGNGSCSGSYKDILNNGDYINPVAGDNRVQIKVFFKRSLPNFADQEWKIWRGLGQTKYRRVLPDPTLYDVGVDNASLVHRTQFEFGNSTDPSGPIAVNMINDRDRNLSIALAMGVGYGSTINATNPIVYNGAFGTHPALATTATAGSVIMKRPDGQFLIISGNTATANAQLYDPAAQTITAQSGAGNIPTVGTGLGAFAFKRPDGKFLIITGNAATTTNIYDPLAASGSRFTAGPALTAAAGRGALPIPLPNGRVLILHGNFTSTTSVYDPFQNTMVAGPTPSAVIGGGAMAIPRPNGTFFIVLGVATEACTALNTTTNNFDPYTMIFTATGSPAITTGVGPGAFAFQRSDGQWVIVHGGGTASTCAGTNRTQIYNPITNQSVVGPTTSGVNQHGAQALPRPDGTWLIIHGGALTTTSIYLEKTGAFTANGLANIGQFIAGPALVTAASAGSTSFQRDDGKFVTITGNAGSVVQQYDVNWVASGLYRSEQMNISDLGANSTLVWKASPSMFGISAEVRTASSQLGLQTAVAREVSYSGAFINPAGGETWVQVGFNLKRTFPSYSGIYTDTWWNGGSTIVFNQRTILSPIITEYKISQDRDILNLKTDANSVFRVSASGDIFTSSSGAVYTGGADLAERYTSEDILEPGDVVAIDPKYEHGVKLSNYQYQKDLIGVVSTSPGFVAGSYTENSYPIALVGRVPVKVSRENGNIYVGDSLTSSSIPGIAMRATKRGLVIGRALESYNETSTGDKIVAFVNTQEFGGEERSIQEVGSDLLDSASKIIQKTGSGIVLGVQDEFAKAYDKIVSRLAIIENLFSKKITITPDGVITLPAGENQISGHGIIKAGEFYVEIANTQVTKTSKIIITPLAATNAQMAVSQKNEGKNFVVQLDAKTDVDIPFDWVMLQTYDAGELGSPVDISTLDLSSNETGLTTDVLGSSSELKLLSKTVKLDTIKTAAGTDIQVELASDGSFVIRNDAGQDILTVDAVGNAVLSGDITGKSLSIEDIKSPILDELRLNLDDLASVVNGLGLDVENYKIQIENKLSDLIASQDLLAANFDGLAGQVAGAFTEQEGLEVAGTSILGGLEVNGISSVADAITLQNDVIFFGRPYFTTDTAGFALIKQGSKSVDVTFDKEYLEQPIVNATITFNDNNNLNETDPSVIQIIRDQQDQLAQQLFDAGMQYLVTRKSERGFTILLNKQAPQDVMFSWTALAVKGAKLFSSKETSVSLPQPDAVTDYQPVYIDDPIKPEDLLPPSDTAVSDPEPVVAGENVIVPTEENAPPPSDSNVSDAPASD